MGAQQSHHCGIETIGHIVRLSGLIGSNRTIVGLKPMVSVLHGTASIQQQSHHCGIETLTDTVDDEDEDRQQSHHCGIETTASVPLLFKNLPAAIAPLWD